MAGHPPGGGRRAFSDEDSRLDQLAISATSASNQAASSDTIAQKALEEERSSTQQKVRMCIWAVCIIFALVGVVAGVKFYNRYSEAKQQERIVAETLAAQEMEAARLVALAAGTRQAVATRLERFDFDAAAQSVAAAMKDGLEPGISEELENSIRLAGKTRRSELIAEAGAELDRGDLEAARAMIPRVEALEAYSDAGTGLAELQERMRVVAHERALEPGRDLMGHSRDALAQEDWEEALRIFELVGREMYEPKEYADLAETLKKTIGGRLVITLDPPDATFRVGDAEPRRGDEMLVGLEGGKIEFVLQKPGYVPHRGEAFVQYPSVVNVSYTLLPEVPGQLWTLRALQGECAQELVGEYYARKHEGEEWVKALPYLVRPCQAVPPVDEEANRRLTKKKKAALLDETVAAFREKMKADPIGAMNDLTVFGLQYPEFPRSLLLRKCGKRIGSVLEPLARGCCDCRGRGHTPCPGCGGAGERKEDRVCPDCNGTGEKVHQDCHGTGELVCPRCSGKGTTEKQVVEDGRPVIQEVTCAKCEGSGKIRCTACRGTGKISCLRCRGTGEARILGPCSECQGTGHLPCGSCGASGSRDQMTIERRQQVEDEIRQLLGG